MEELKLRTKRRHVDIGQENVRENRRKVTKEVGKKVNPGRKMNSFSKKTGREATTIPVFL